MAIIAVVLQLTLRIGKDLVRLVDLPHALPGSASIRMVFPGKRSIDSLDRRGFSTWAYAQDAIVVFPV